MAEETTTTTEQEEVCNWLSDMREDVDHTGS